jgi:hypothetical protein
MKLRGLIPNSYIHVSMRGLYIPTIGLTILLLENRWTDHRNTVYRSLTDTHECGLRPRSFFSEEYTNRIFFAV